MKGKEAGKYDEEERKKWMKQWMREKKEREIMIIIMVI